MTVCPAVRRSSHAETADPFPLRSGAARGAARFDQIRFQSKEERSMSNDIAIPQPEDDDGFYGSLNSGRPVKGTIAKWSDTEHWRDRDGLPLPSPLLVIAINEGLQMWKD